ncbi:glycosyltransferase family A protein [Aestuariibacter sp. A3R04]|uniref:glycosyltransferase family 2 protein n=1 Tax=Aestuariibacter sp. A3R04 TaxID=2841571 RepID=UPI001C097C74|nr:glycosyltransferase family A protein [Aestuariibacter sp. A3R04]MBU3022183.1 glycosyltransferase family 2 protein [Aestuariibacter sp. A3R04]
MKLSVIVPAYNLEKYIGECLRSVLEQTVNAPFEVIVCDDASTDSTADIIRGLSKEFAQLKPILKTQNGGLANNMRTLLEAATGDYIAYLDGDDVALPGKLQTQIDYLDTHEDCQMVFHESDMFDSDTNETMRLYSQSSYNWSYIPQRSDITHLIRYGTYLQASSVMFRRHAWLTETVAQECKIILDYPFYILNAGYLNANIDFIPNVLGRYRIHQDSFGAQTQRSTARREQSLADICHACELAAQFGVDENAIKAGIAHHQYAAALYFLFRGNTTRFQQWITESASQGYFFDEKHRTVYENRHDPEQIKAWLEREGA